jgi:hypothetical protein
MNRPLTAMRQEAGCRAPQAHMAPRTGIGGQGQRHEPLEGRQGAGAGGQHGVQLPAKPGTRFVLLLLVLLVLLLLVGAAIHSRGSRRYLGGSALLFAGVACAPAGARAAFYLLS